MACLNYIIYANDSSDFADTGARRLHVLSRAYYVELWAN